MTEGEWLAKVSDARLHRRYDAEHVVELISEAPVPLFLISIEKVGGDFHDGGSHLEWSRHFNNVQDAIGFLFDQCELFNKRITSLYYSIEVRMISIVIED